MRRECFPFAAIRSNGAKVICTGETGKSAKREILVSANTEKPAEGSTPAVNTETAEIGSSKGGFARAFDKYTAPATPPQLPEDNQTFASLLRNSKLIDVGTFFK